MAKKMSMSFKEKEDFMWEYLQTKMNACVYMKELILKDMKDKNLIQDSRSNKNNKEEKKGKIIDFDF